MYEIAKVPLLKDTITSLSISLVKNYGDWLWQGHVKSLQVTFALTSQQEKLPTNKKISCASQAYLRIEVSTLERLGIERLFPENSLPEPELLGTMTGKNSGMIALTNPWRLSVD